MKQQNRLKNSCKNIALVALTLLLIVLVILTWSTTLGRRNVPRDSLLAQVYSILPFQSRGYVQRAGDTPLSYPSSIAMTTEEGLRGTFYDESTLNSFYDVVRPIWATALSKTVNFETATQEQFCKALAEKDTLYQSYNSGLPFILLSGWLGADAVQTEERAVISLVLTRDGTLFVRGGEDGALYRARETLSVQDSVWEEAAGKITAPVCKYAYTLDASNVGALLPESLIANTAAYDVFEMRSPAFGNVGSGDSLQALLKAFGYDPYVQNYLENDGTKQVFVENYSSLRVSDSGTVTFKANSVMGGLVVYQDGEQKRSEMLAAQADYAAGVLNAALSAIGSTIPAELRSVQYEEQSETQYIEFAQVISSVPVRNQVKPLARFRFQGGTLIMAELCLQDYHPTGEKLYVLPVQQAAAALQGKGTDQYVIAYAQEGDGRLLPHAYNREWGDDNAVG